MCYNSNMHKYPKEKNIQLITASIHEAVLSHLVYKDKDKTLLKECADFLVMLEHEITIEKDDAFASNVIRALKDELPSIFEKIEKDALAAQKGDPAARSLEEVVIAYPYMKVIAVHRIAHFLYTHDVYLVPRLLSECMHALTGIDIHPGSKIGESFFIDHGTGTVIGETAIIGNNVKIYQGVTLGAYSFPKDGCGNFIKTTKRHPTIEDNVIIYSNASILGDITIGKNSVIGSNVWINTDVPSDTMVILKAPETVIKPISPKTTIKNFFHKVGI